MKHALLLLAILFLSATYTYPQSTVADWFPVHQGDKWIYEHETRNSSVKGDLPPVETHGWKTEETTTGLWTVPEGELVDIRVRVTDGVSPNDVKREWDKVYLIRDDRLYRDVDWDPSAHQLTADYRQWLDSDISPDFWFPLTVHKTWGAPHYLSGEQERPASEAKDWEVAEIKVQDSAAPDKKDTFHITSISSYLGPGMTGDIWFEKGVGIIREELIHHGTIWEERSHLIAFQPASRN